MSDVPDFDDEHLEMDLKLPESEGETTLPDVYVGLEIDLLAPGARTSTSYWRGSVLEIDLLAPGDGIITDRHHASADRCEADDPQNQIAGQVSPFTLSGWLRHGCERVLQTAGATACHPSEASAEFMMDDVYEQDLDAGYHEKGSCVEDGGIDWDRALVVDPDKVDNALDVTDSHSSSDNEVFLG